MITFYSTSGYITCVVLLVLVIAISRFAEKTERTGDIRFRNFALCCLSLAFEQVSFYIYPVAALATIIAVIFCAIKEEGVKRKRYIVWSVIAVSTVVYDMVFNSYTTVMLQVMTVIVITEYLFTLIEQISLDGLTGLNNRRALDRYLTYLFENTPESEIIYAVMIDINGLKWINDTEGHTGGDKTIVKMADVLKVRCSEIKGRPFLARYGGDEFVICGKGEPGTDVSIFRDLPVSAGMEVGKRGKYQTHLDLLEMADRRMYIDKKEQRNR